MTLLAAWVGVDLKKTGPKIASIYFATDSRITWPNGETHDEFTKVYGMEYSPDIFCFCGDVLFATATITQIVKQADLQLFFPINASADEKFALIENKISNAIFKYPVSQTAASFKIFYATRDVNQDFHCYCLEWSIKNGLSSTKLILPDKSTVIAVAGSGREEFEREFKDKHDKPKFNNHGTSRTVYHCFVQTLENIRDPQCGGIPQIIGLYRIKNAISFGIVKDKKRFLNGSEINQFQNLKFVEWRNELFERIEPEKMEILSSAQRQPRS
ncbi:MAG TPA: hypothetical protein VG367_03520 [Mucilaginibacter sp.]|jgi:hypothetical protein|nr:hypothetical protein [Mucilaginibacter sp.]